MNAQTQPNGVDRRREWGVKGKVIEIMNRESKNREPGILNCGPSS